jgi:hypothetical protein
MTGRSNPLIVYPAAEMFLRPVHGLLFQFRQRVEANA